MATLSIKNDAVTEVAQLLIDPVGTDEVATSKITIGAAGVNDGFVSAANPLPVTGTITAVTSVTNVVHVDDNAGSLTVDNAALSVVGGGAEATALRVTLASDSTGVVSVDDNGGSLTIDATSLPLPTGAASAANQATEIASLASIDGKITAVNTGAVVVSSSALPSGASTAAKQPALGTAGTASADVITVQGIASMTALKTDGSAVTQPVSDGGGSLTVDGTVAATQSGTWTVQPGNTANTTAWKVDASSVAVPVTDNSGSLTVDDGGSSLTVDGTVAVSGTVAVTDNSGSLTVDAPVATPVYVRLSDGAAAISTLPVSLASVPSHAVTNAGTFATQAAAAGDVAHDSADSGNPVKCGAKASTSLAGRTMVADSDRTDLVAGIDGAQIVRPYCNLEDIVSGQATNTDGTSTQCIAAQAAGIKTYLTTIILANSSASFCTVDIKDGTTVKLTIPVPATGGAVCNLPVPIGGTAATAWNFDPSAATSTVSCSMVGFKSKV